MKFTENLKLKKPDGTDVVNIDDLNDNMDILDSEVNKKVDKVNGKGLSTEDYTTDEKDKLSGIEKGANKTTINNTLTSTNTTQALSAKQGKALKDEIIEHKAENAKRAHLAKNIEVEDGKTLDKFIKNKDTTQLVEVRPADLDNGILDRLIDEGSYIIRSFITESMYEDIYMDVFKTEFKNNVYGAVDLITQISYPSGFNASESDIGISIRCRDVNGKWLNQVTHSYKSMAGNIIVTGSFTENKSESTTINLGFKPRYLKLIYNTEPQAAGIVEKVGSDNNYWAIHLDGEHEMYSDNLMGVYLTNDGFEVSKNISSNPIRYLAIR